MTFEWLKYLDREPVFASERVLRPLLQAFLTFRKALVPRPLSAQTVSWQPYTQVLHACFTYFPTAMIATQRLSQRWTDGD